MDWHDTWDADWHDVWHGPDDAPEIPGQGPPGVGTFALTLENGYTVTYRWHTDVIPTASGKEQRISINDHAKESYDGRAILLGSHAADVRTQLAQSAAQGQPIQLGLQHEEILLRANAAGTTVYVIASQLALCDWTNAGQRVVVVREDADGVLQSVEAVIQSTTADSITLDVAPGDLGLYGGRIMPTMPVLLEPQQDFLRYPLDVEIWNHRARAMTFDFARSLATLALGPLTTAAGLEDATITERSPGSGVSFELNDDAIFGLPVVLNEFGTSTIAQCTLVGTPVTVAQLYAALSASALVAPTGTWGVGSLSAADEIPLTELTGGSDEGPVGTGATVETYASRPLWDRLIRIDTTNTDSIHAGTHIIEFTGVPYAVGTLDQPDWGRAVAAKSDQRSEFQWLKKFLWTVKGCQKAFWLPTWRDDLPFVSKAANVITVSGNVGAWWPTKRQHVQVWETSGTLTYAEVTAAVNNGDGTWTLTIGTTLASSSVRMVSWLELCRFEKDEFPVTFSETGYSMSVVARGVQR